MIGLFIPGIQFMFSTLTDYTNDFEVEEIMLLFFRNGKVWAYFIILGMVIEYLRWGFY
jgi:hypothetical protein